MGDVVQFRAPENKNTPAFQTKIYSLQTGRPVHVDWDLVIDLEVEGGVVLQPRLGAEIVDLSTVRR